MEQNTTATASAIDDDKQKGRNGWRIATVIASIVAICGIGFGVYGMFFNDIDKKVTNNTDVDVNTAIDTNSDTTKETIKEAPSREKIAEVLENKYGVKEFNDSSCGGSTAIKLFNGEELDDTFRLVFIIRKDFFNIQEMEYDDCDGACEYKDISYDDINEKNHLYFGNSNDLKKEDYDSLRVMGVDEAKYIEETNSFRVKYPGGIGCAPIPAGYYVNVASVEADGDEFTALISVFHLDASDATSNGARISGCSDGVYDCPILNMDSLKTENNIYELKFVEEDGEYKLTGVVKK